MDDNMSTNGLEDDMSTMSTDEPSEEVYPYVFPLSTHTIVGSYLIIIGKSFFFPIYWKMYGRTRIDKNLKVAFFNGKKFFLKNLLKHFKIVYYIK